MKRARLETSMGEAQATTRSRILEAALVVIERDGAERATVRAIASEAGVNVAAINYHYRSKDELLEAAVAGTWAHAIQDLRSFLVVEPVSLKDRIEDFVLYLLRGGRQYPNLTRAYLFGAGAGPYPAILEGQRAFAAEFAARVGSLLGRAPDAALVVRTTALYSFCLFAALAPEALPPEIGAEDFASAARILAKDYLDAVKGYAP